MWKGSFWPNFDQIHYKTRKSLDKTRLSSYQPILPVGIEPTTHGLRVRCSASWAKEGKK